MTLAELLIRLLIAFFALVFLARLMGKKEISQMTLFNFVSAMTLGTLGGALLIDPALSILHGVITLAGWSALTLLMGFFDIKSARFRKWLDGEPVIVIKDGKIMEKSMRKVQLDIDSLRTMLREKDVFSMKDVHYAIFEVDGKLSVMKKSGIQNKNRMGQTNGMPDIVYPFPTEVISDGIVNRSNLNKLKLSEDWLEEQLMVLGVPSVSEVFYAEVQQDGSLYIDSRHDYLH
ncbi:membrane protein [Mesobacillus campisalis]|uniref:Membrane protein n=1 Tax=Mesobacillus campisalis TaxID=1408103 RepID=A0A0M2SVH5_9BACI|nr:DUF421 domain-containing protein [Mesobacillus campisalis]KKK38569.1 membrane protein [Mesobacillus campisalis]